MTASSTVLYSTGIRRRHKYHRKMALICLLCRSAQSFPYYVKTKFLHIFALPAKLLLITHNTCIIKSSFTLEECRKRSLVSYLYSPPRASLLLSPLPKDVKKKYPWSVCIVRHLNLLLFIKLNNDMYRYMIC